MAEQHPPTHPTVAITRGGLPGTLHIPDANLIVAPQEPQLSRQGLLDFVSSARASALITMFHDQIDAHFLAAAGPQLKSIHTFAVGYDNIDLPACKARNIIVTNTPDVVTPGTANLAWALLLAVARNLVPADAFVRSGNFESQGNNFPRGWMGMHLYDQTLCVLGAGRIGLAVAQRAIPFGMKLTYVSPSPKPAFDALGAQRQNLTEALTSADVLSIHVPLSAQTKHLIGPKEFALLKPTAIIINTARGPIIDEDALVHALESGKLYGAGLDVFEHEPSVHPTLRTLANVVLTPHIGSSEKFWREKMTTMVCAAAHDVLQGRNPSNRIA